HVGARDERTRLAAPQHDARQALSRLQLAERTVEIGEGRLVEHVEPARGIVHDEVDEALRPLLDPEDRHQSRSSTNAAPWPPPTQSAARPRFPFRRRISWSSVSSSRAPLEPTGCPSAIAPPLGLRSSGGISPSACSRPSSLRANAGDRNAARHASTCAANAS